MIKSAVTVSLVNEARGGPFVFWDDLPAACEKAAELGFDAIELFAPSDKAVPPAELRGLLDGHGLSLAAVGTGAGWVKHKLQLCDADTQKREQAKQFIRAIIDFGGQFAAPAIIGSMQGRFGDGVDRDTAMQYFAEALNELGEYASRHNVPLIYEPLNRYETNLVNTMGAGVALLESLSTDNVVLLADLFHMNIEEVSIAQGLLDGGKHIGHLHFVDSNRRAVGYGHMDYTPIADALRQIKFEGYASAEALSYPDADQAASKTMAGYKQFIVPLNQPQTVTE